MIDQIHDLPNSDDVIICIGDGSVSCSEMAEKLAQAFALDYHKILDKNTKIVPGIYHTSVYDITLAEIIDKLKLLDLAPKIRVLDLPPSQYSNPEDYIKTMDMIGNLSRWFSVHYDNDENVTWMSKTIKNNTAFCIMPFVGLYQAGDKASFCCHMPKIWPTGVIDYHGPVASQIRQQMLEGIRVPLCAKCYDLDDSGATSDRETWTKKFSSKFNIQSYDDLAKNISVKTAHIAVDNQCNLLCRTCCPGNSNLIEKEYKSLNIYQAKKILPLPNKVPDDLVIDNLAEILVTGGEPTVNHEFLDFLLSMPIEVKNRLSVTLSTNALVLSSKLKKVVDQIPGCKFGISLDGFNHTNFYIRWPSDWTKIISNISWFYHQGRLSHFNTTVSIYNITRLHQLYAWLDQEYPDIPCWMNFVTDPEHMIPWNFPDKSIVFQSLEQVEKLGIYKKSYDLQKNINAIRSSVNSWVHDTDRLERFFQFNDKLDFSRKVHLADYIPELDFHRPTKHHRKDLSS